MDNTIEVAAVSRESQSAQLGDLYDARKDKFNSIQLFKESLPNETVIGTENWHTNLKLTLSDTLEDKFNLMDISASIKVSIMSGLISLEGSGKFFKDTKKSAKSVQAHLIHTIRTKYEQINMVSSAIGKLIDLDTLKDTDCTHVVVGIQWGGSAFMKVEDSNQDNQETQVIEGKLAAQLEKLSLKINGEASVNVSEEEKATFSKFSLEVFGDLSIDKVPQNVVDAVKFMRDVPAMIKSANDGRGKAISYSMIPISLLRKRFKANSTLNSMVKDINDATVKRATKLFDELNVAEAELYDLMNNVKPYETYLPGNQTAALAKVKDEFDIMELEAQKALADHLVRVRSGQEEAYVLEDVVSNYTARLDNSKLNQLERYNDLKPGLKLVKFLQKENVALLKKDTIFTLLLRKYENQDVYVLFYKLNDHSDDNQNVINTFQTMLRKKHLLGNASFVAASYETLNENPRQPAVDSQNRTKIIRYRYSRIEDNDYKPGKNITDGTEPEFWSLDQIKEILNASGDQLKQLDVKHNALSKKTETLADIQRKLNTNPSIKC